MNSALNTPEMVFAKDLTRRIREEAPRPLGSWELVISKGQKQTSWKSRKTGRNGAGPPHVVFTVSDRFVHAPQSIINDIATQLSSILRGEWGAGRAATARIHAWSSAKRRAR